MSKCTNAQCAGTIPTFGTIDQCDLAGALRSGEIARLIYFKCDSPFTDILDPAEWTTKLGANELTWTPLGNGNIGEITEEGEVRIGCFDVATISKKPFEFNSPLVDNTTQNEWVAYNDLKKAIPALTIGYLTCDGHLLIDPRYTSGEVPGIKISKHKIDQVFTGEANSKMNYKITGEIEENCSLRVIELPDTVTAIIQ